MLHVCVGLNYKCVQCSAGVSILNAVSFELCSHKIDIPFFVGREMMRGSFGVFEKRHL